jgi:cytochrome c553
VLKKHYKLIIAILLFLPFIVFIDKIVFAYMEPKALEAIKSGEAVQKLYGAKCAMCHGVKGEGMADYPKINGFASKEEALAKIKAHKDGMLGNIQMSADVASLSEAEKEELASFVASLKVK